MYHFFFMLSTIFAHECHVSTYCIFCWKYSPLPEKAMGMYCEKYVSTHSCKYIVVYLLELFVCKSIYLFVNILFMFTDSLEVVLWQHFSSVSFTEFHVYCNTSLKTFLQDSVWRCVLYCVSFVEFLLCECWWGMCITGRC